jgi:RNA polymerase primary sigma factor
LENQKFRKSPNPSNAIRTYGVASDSFEVYSQEIRKFPVLTQEEESALFKAVKEHDPAAKNSIITGTLRLVIKFARKWAHGGVSFDDLVQEGNIGLLTAVDKFDHTKGCRFSTYACFWIKDAISRSAAVLGRPVSLPSRKADDIKKADREYDRLAQILGREPSAREIVATLGWTEEYAALLCGFAQTPLSRDALADGGDAATANADRDDTAAHAILTMLRKDIDKALKGLSRLERKVILLRYGLNGGYAHTLKETGEICGICHQRVHQIEAKALRCLRKSEHSHVLIGYREEK